MGRESETEAENERRNEREGGAGTNQGAETAGETRNPGAEIARPINGRVERGMRSGRGGGEIVAAAVAVVVVAALLAERIHNRVSISSEGALPPLPLLPNT